MKVEEFKKNPVTGSYGALVTMTNNEGKSVYFDYLLLDKPEAFIIEDMKEYIDRVSKLNVA